MLAKQFEIVTLHDELCTFLEKLIAIIFDRFTFCDIGTKQICKLFIRNLATVYVVGLLNVDAVTLKLWRKREAFIIAEYADNSHEQSALPLWYDVHSYHATSAQCCKVEVFVKVAHCVDIFVNTELNE